MYMRPELLHRHLKMSLRHFSSSAASKAFRALLESGSVEGFLRDLLFIELHARKHNVAREEPIKPGRRPAADIVIHDSGKLFIEAKQLHLKDWGRHAPTNLVKDLKRHGKLPALGVMYIVDERNSTSEALVKRFNHQNRKTTYDVAAAREALLRHFRIVVPASEGGALLREFKGAGGVKVHGFVVKSPRSRPLGTPKA